VPCATTGDTCCDNGFRLYDAEFDVVLVHVVGGIYEAFNEGTFSLEPNRRASGTYGLFATSVATGAS
jgi:hypothetical protein